MISVDQKTVRKGNFKFVVVGREWRNLQYQATYWRAKDIFSAESSSPFTISPVSAEFHILSLKWCLGSIAATTLKFINSARMYDIPAGKEINRIINFDKRTILEQKLLKHKEFIDKSTWKGIKPVSSRPNILNRLGKIQSYHCSF